MKTKNNQPKLLTRLDWSRLCFKLSSVFDVRLVLLHLKIHHSSTYEPELEQTQTKQAATGEFHCSQFVRNWPR